MLQQRRLNGTWYGYDPTSNQLIAFSDVSNLKKYFPQGLDKNAPTLEVDPSLANKSANTLVSLNTPQKPSGQVAYTFPDGSQYDVNGKQLKAPTNPSPSSGSSVTVTGSQSTPAIQIPDTLANDQFYKQLDPENQKIVSYFYQTLTGGSKDQTTAFQQALDEAAKTSDPYFREKANILKDELSRSLASADSDLATTEKDLSQRIQRIRDDLTYNKDQLSLEQQSDLARQAREYESQLESTRATMADRGLSMSSINTKAQERLSAENEDIITSTKRKYDRENRNLDTSSARQIQDYQSQIDSLTRKTSEAKTSDVRKVESVLGTQSLSDLPGAVPLTLGNVSGTIKSDQSNDILARASALLSAKYPALNLK